MTLETCNAGQAACNMVFTQGHGFVVGASSGLSCWSASLSRVGLPRRGHRLFGNVEILFDKLFFCCDAFWLRMRSGVVMNLPLGGSTRE